jgi:glycosyltransferase involved in cell wall biosynthesis
MRIAFDATTLTPDRTGVGYYTEHLLHHLLEAGREHELLLLTNRRVHTARPLSRPVIVLRRGWIPYRTLWLQLEGPRILRQACPDVAHFTNSLAPLAGATPVVVTIHDMSLFLMPRMHPWRRVLTRPLIGAVLKRADAVITVSEAVRADLLRLTRIPPERIHVVYEAATDVFRPMAEGSDLAEARRRLGIPEPFILFVGTLEPRKNLVRLVEAFAGGRRSGALARHTLVLAGLPGWRCQELFRRIAALDLEKCVLLPGYVPFQDIPALYNLSEIFAFPSLHEGFGLPVLEAMACGTPVITSRNTALEEIAGQAAELVDAHDVGSIAAALRRLVVDGDRRRELSRLGLERARRFSWGRAARETLEVYRRCVA